MSNNLYIFAGLPYTKNNTIRFSCTGALDFTEHVEIHLSKEELPGFTMIHPNEFLKTTHLPYISYLIKSKVFNVLGRMPHISDSNEDLPEEQRLTKMWYKCEYMYHHSHDFFKKPLLKQYELKTAINKIKHKKLNLC